MGKRSKQRGGVVALECEWSRRDLRRPETIRSILEVLQAATNGEGKFIHRRVGSVDHFAELLQTVTQKKYANYRIIWIAGHGSPNRIHVEDKGRDRGAVDLDWLEAQLEERCAGRIIHIGCRATLRVSERRLKQLKQNTGAVAVCGFRKQIDWCESLAFELYLFTQFIHASPDGRGMNAVVRRVRSDMQSLAQSLGFVMC